MKEKLKILFIEDNSSDAKIIFNQIERDKIPFDGKLVDSKKEYLAALKLFKPDIIISGFTLPDFDGMLALAIRNKVAPEIPFILVTGSINEEVAVCCMKSGADDYLIKNNLSRLGEAIKSAVRKNELIRQKEAAEKMIEENEKKYRLMVDLSPDAVIVHSIDGMLYANTTALRLLGADSLDDIKNIPAINFVHPDYRDNALKRITSIYKTCEPTEYLEEKLINLKNEIFDVEVIGIPVTFFGKPAIQTIVRDISYRKKTEEDLRRSKREFQSYFESGSIGMGVTAADKIWIEVNQRLCRMFGYTKEELIGRAWTELSHPDDLPSNLALFQQALDGKIDNYEVDKRFIHKDGQIVYVTLSVVCQRNDDGSVHHFSSSYIDITDRKISEDALRESYEFNKFLLRTIPFGMGIVDEEGSVLFQSENLQKTFGPGVPGKKCWDLYRDDKKQCSECPLSKGIKIGVTETYEAHGILGGRIFDISHTGMMFQGKKAMLEIFQDITERKQVEIELVHAKEKAEESDRLKTAFLHNISHEIRTPLNAIVGFSALLREPGQTPEVTDSYVDIIMQSSDLLLAIVGDIIEISNIEAGITKIKKTDTDLNSIMKRMYDKFKPLAAAKMIELSYETSLPEGNAMVQTDDSKLIKILSNLISNAIKFTAEGMIEFGYKLKKNNIRFYVSDTGIGIPEEQQARVFDRFYQVENSMKKLYEGTGLGLAITKAYVELFGGKIWLRSEPDKGSVFYFTIPYEEVSKPGTTEFHIKRVRKEAIYDSKTLLIAEDDNNNYYLMKKLLADLNIKILRAANGIEAVDICRSGEQIDMVLMDIKMPVMDGYEATRQILEQSPGMRIIAQTAYADDEKMALKSGCAGFISKPFDKRHLLNMVKNNI